MHVWVFAALYAKATKGMSIIKDMGIGDNSGIFGIFAGNVEDIWKIVISIIISNSQILDIYVGN